MSTTLQFRSDPELDRALDIIVREAKKKAGEGASKKRISRSMVARSILKQALESTEDQIVWAESISWIYAVTQRVVQRALHEVMTSLEDIIADELGIEDEEA